MKTTNESPFGTNRKNAVIAGVLFIIGTVSGVISAVILNLPIFPQEMVFAVWLIVKGVQQPIAAASVSVQPAMS